MRPIYHVAISGGVTAILAVWVRSWSALTACFLSGIFIDLDHHLDYVLARKEVPLNYKKLVDFCDNDHTARIYLILHSYELLFLVWAAIFVLGLNEVWFAIAVGMTVHVLCDEFANPLRPLAYFLTLRAMNRFERKLLFKKGYIE